MGKRPEGEGGKPYRFNDNWWRAEVMVGYNPDGTRRRKRVYGRTEKECMQALRAALRERDQGNLATGKAPKLIDWLDHWLANVPPKRLRERTRREYAGLIGNWVRNTRTAQIRIDKLTPEHLEALYKPLRDAGRSETTVTHLHRILSRALKVAVQRKKIAVNPATLLDAPQPAKYEPTVLTTAQVETLVDTARHDGHAARWLIALTLGPRQGESLGLAWDDIDMGEDTIRVRREIYRLAWLHGCNPEGEPACGRKRGVDCPARHSGGIFTGKPKSEAGTRNMPIPPQLKPLLEAHRAAQPEAEPWVSANGEALDLVFRRPDGRPLDMRQDWGAWKALLKKAGVPDVRPHDARHTAATTMLLLGVPPRVVMEIMGWSQASMLQRYQHVMDEAKLDAADKEGLGT